MGRLGVDGGRRAALLCALWWVGCGEPAGNGSGQNNVVGCVQGAPVACVCPDSSMSTATCLANGVPGACSCQAAGSGAAGTLAAGTGGGSGMTAAGSGGMLAAGSGGMTPAGTGGTLAAGAGGMDAAGSGGMAAAGSGGAAGTMQPAPGEWPAADPAGIGPFETTTENDVGPGNAFTLFRPIDLAQSGQLHPVVTWGNGTGTMPTTYSRLLDQLASHGFVVIASNSPNVAQGSPPPMLAGVTWVIEQNAAASSPMYQHIDVDRIGATGHSQGALATCSAGADPRIKTIAPLQGARAGTLHGPALLLCGGMDTTLPCSGSDRALGAIDSVPVMSANLLAATHTNWIASAFGGTPSPYFEAVTAWMRVHLMDDVSLRPMFYGAGCGLCTDPAWSVMQKMMD